MRIATAAAADAPNLPDGPVKRTWESIGQNYKDPEWFRDAKLGIMMHWGLYSVPAHGSEWYVRHMYGNPGFAKWHIEKYGALDKFGYKDFIPLFTADKYNPDEWAELFKKTGAKYVVPSAEHHDGWANWDSDITEFCATKMGPKRDLIGDMAIAVRKQGLKFGVSNHRLNHYDFINPAPNVDTDLNDPKYDDFYWVANHSDERYQKFLADWVARAVEQIDKYQVDMLWFDIGGESRNTDPVFLKVAAHYYNRAKEWNKEVAISAKGNAFPAGMIVDYERQGRAPVELTEYVWQADDPIGNKFGYVEGMELTTPSAVVWRLVENTSKNGNLLLNISPKADGTIPKEQQDIMLAVGKWMDINGDGIYGSRPWKKYGEGPAADAAAEQAAKNRAAGIAGRTNGRPTGGDVITGGGVPRAGYTPQDIRFTTKGNTLYAFAMTWPGDQMVIKSLAAGQPMDGAIAKVELLGHATPLEFTQDANGLNVKLPAQKPGDYVYTLRITGLQLDTGNIPQ
ncbi:MAG: alpha-L-fucosidase [Burkholderiales bacterium]|nr:alpha-L-fucosidase [Phycisphaerae bacterium]